MCFLTALLALAGITFVHEPFSEYAVQRIEGFSVYLSKAARQHPDTTAPALIVLADQLRAVARVVSREALETLRTIPFFIEQENPGFPCACYHTSAEWLKENGYIPQKRHSVEISNTRNFVKWIAEDQPWMVLHELAHAYHDVRFTFDDPYIRACHRLALARGNYESVEHVKGSKRRHYALTNPMEYFAETTEAYFGKNDFYPFGREELRKADPQGLAMIERLWRTN